MPSKIIGYATAQATQAFADRRRARHPSFEPGAYRPLTGTDLITSKIGYGTYRVHDQSDAHVETLKAAIESGCNLIDTSSNYTDGGSETLIGNVLRELIADGKIQREEMIVVSKVGYMQGQNLDEAMRRERAGTPWQEVVKYMDGCWHCLHPDFLTDQWTRSADRLGLETIDVYLLHNAEYFLSDAHHRTPRGALNTIRDTFYERIYRAFMQMERFVRDGKIRYYGISSNTFPTPKTDFEHVSLNRIYDAASKAAETVHGAHRASGFGESLTRPHHFKVIQLPYNLLEGGALTEVNNGSDGKGVTVLEAAVALGIGVLVNRPLNAVKNNRMSRLAQYPYDPNLDYQQAVSTAADTLDEIESMLRRALENWGIFSQVEEAVNLDLFYDIAPKLQQFLPRVHNREHWEQITQQYLIPQINAYLRQTAQACPNPHQAEWAEMLQKYAEGFNTLFTLITGHFNRLESKQVEGIQGAVDGHLSADEKKLTLSQKALNFVTSSSGVSVVLNGMKRHEYVADAMGIMGVPNFAQPLALVESVKQKT